MRNKITWKWLPSPKSKATATTEGSDVVAPSGPTPTNSIQFLRDPLPKARSRSNAYGADIRLNQFMEKILSENLTNVIRCVVSNTFHQRLLDCMGNGVDPLRGPGGERGGGRC